MFPSPPDPFPPPGPEEGDGDTAGSPRRPEEGGAEGADPEIPPTKPPLSSDSRSAIIFSNRSRTSVGTSGGGPGGGALSGGGGGAFFGGFTVGGGAGVSK